MLAPAGVAAAAGGGGGTGPPSGPPTNGYLFRHSGNKIGVGWTNGDTSASTRIYYYDSSGGCPTIPGDLVYVGQASPGATTYNTSYLDTVEQCSFWIVHFKNDQYSDYAQVTDILDEGTCFACPT